MTEMIVALLQNSILAASAEYFRWSNGVVLYDVGAENILQVYAARYCFEGLQAAGHNAVVRVERKIGDLVEGGQGRLDLTVEVNEGLYCIELKRYTNPAMVKPDLDRLDQVIHGHQNRQNRVGLFGAPCYLYLNNDHNNWPANWVHDRNIENEQYGPNGDSWRATDPIALPWEVPGQRSHHSAMVVVVGHRAEPRA